MKFRRVRIFLILLALLGMGGALLIQASDHSDFPAAGEFSQLGNITDLHAFVVRRNLVLSLSTNAAIPPTATRYMFPTNVTFDVNIDVDSAVDTSSDPFGDGGTILDPRSIREDITFRISFRDDGSVNLRRFGQGGQTDPQVVSVFTGLRDDPFIRLGRQGRNIAAIVLEVPLSSIISSQSTLLIWATSKVDVFGGEQQEHAGRALRSMFDPGLNLLHPKEQGARPDVIIYDTSKKAAFPNGRALKDDVVDLACALGGECTLFKQEGKSGPKKTDVPFLKTFPYLAPPHDPPAA